VQWLRIRPLKKTVAKIKQSAPKTKRTVARIKKIVRRTRKNALKTEKKSRAAKIKLPQTRSKIGIQYKIRKVSLKVSSAHGKNSWSNILLHEFFL
jgi:hypothetical protein